MLSFPVFIVVRMYDQIAVSRALIQEKFLIIKTACMVNMSYNGHYAHSEIFAVQQYQHRYRLTKEPEKSVFKKYI